MQEEKIWVHNCAYWMKECELFLSTFCFLTLNDLQEPFISSANYAGHVFGIEISVLGLEFTFLTFEEIVNCSVLLLMGLIFKEFVLLAKTVPMNWNLAILAIDQIV
jgi:hypothetical protein